MFFNFYMLDKSFLQSGSVWLCLAFSHLGLYKSWMNLHNAWLAIRWMNEHSSSLTTGQQSDADLSNTFPLNISISRVACALCASKDGQSIQLNVFRWRQWIQQITRSENKIIAIVCLEAFRFWSELAPLLQRTVQ